MSTSESWFLEYPTSGDSFSCKICMYLCPPPPAQFWALVNVKPARLSHSTLGSEQSQAWEKNVHDTFTSAILRDTSFSWCIVRKYISGNSFSSASLLCCRKGSSSLGGGERWDLKQELQGRFCHCIPYPPLTQPRLSSICISLLLSSFTCCLSFLEKDPLS